MKLNENNAIGIFGGSFDPPHLAHLKIVKISLKIVKLKKIFWVITRKNPFKTNSLFSIKERFIKSKKLIKGNKKITVLFLDNKIKSSRTINIINYFRNVKKQKNLYLIIGSDNLLTFHKWKNWKKIVKFSKLVVFSRRGYVKKSKESKVVKYLNKKNIIFLKNDFVNISSSKLRRALK